MCSVGEENIEDLERTKFMQEKSNFKLLQKNCNKCRIESPCIVLRSKDAYCKECFLAGTVHKFKALLGKHRFIRPQDSVLIFHKTGHPSIALLHFIRTGLDLLTPKKLRFQPIIVFIEDSYDLGVGQRRDVLCKVEQQVKNFNFPIHFISFTQYISNPDQIGNNIQTDFHNVPVEDTDIENIENVCNKANLTTREQMLHVLKYELLVNVAKHLNCKCILMPDIAIDVASCLLTNISLGRGAQLSLDIGVSDTRYSEVQIIKPLRVFEMKELAFYNILNQLEPVSVVLPKQNPNKSIQSLMKKFVADLQDNYPATITTVVKTGDKLVMDKNASDNDACLLCKAPKENVAANLNSAEATNFSHWISTRAFNNCVDATTRYEEVLSGFKAVSKSDYCFSCSRIMSNIQN